MRPERIEADKQQIREQVWAKLVAERAALFPGARGRIPNFKGAAAAADRLAETQEWKRARAIKCNPDAPQRPVRFRALREGKIVYMAVPRLREKKAKAGHDRGDPRARTHVRPPPLRRAPLRDVVLEYPVGDRPKGNTSLLPARKRTRSRPFGSPKALR
jgi:5-formyltetrahydrofolate cyclo-ligase